MRLGLCLLAFIAACSSSTSSAPAEPFTCTLGALTGSWSVDYEETAGDCGPLPEEVATVPSPPPPGKDAGAPADNGCTYAASLVSPDKCSINLDFTCPLTTVKNSTQHWNGALHQTSATALRGTLGLQVTGPTVNCRSTYYLMWTKL